MKDFSDTFSFIRRHLKFCIAFLAALFSGAYFLVAVADCQLLSATHLHLQARRECWKALPCVDYGNHLKVCGHEWKSGSDLAHDDQVMIDLHKDAEKGDPVAQRQLGDAYSDLGRRTPPQPGFGDADSIAREDILEALKWYSLAADAGDFAAQYQLSHFYEVGYGVPQSYAEAYFWIILSQQGGTPLSASRINMIKNNLSYREIQDSVERVNAWNSKRLKP